MARIRQATGHALERELRLVRASVAASGHAIGSKRKYEEVLRRFDLFLRHGLRVENLHEVSREHMEEFLRAPAGDSTVPVSIGTMHIRRAAVRLAFRIAREQGLLDHDPTLDLSLPRRPEGRCRPLLGAEVERCRSASLHSLSETRLPAAWALAEATATPQEIAIIRPDDLDLDRQCVRLIGAGHLAPRSGELTDWGVEQLQRRIHHQVDPDAGLVYRGHGSENSARASVSQAIRWSLVRAGLGADPLVKPSSSRAWRAHSWAGDGVPIQEIAARLGMRSLDRVTALIGDDLR